MIKILRCGSLFNESGSLLNTFGLNSQHWKNDPRVIFQPVSKFFVTWTGSLMLPNTTKCNSSVVRYAIDWFALHMFHKRTTLIFLMFSTNQSLSLKLCYRKLTLSRQLTLMTPKLLIFSNNRNQTKNSSLISYIEKSKHNTGKLASWYGKGVRSPVSILHDQQDGVKNTNYCIAKSVTHEVKGIYKSSSELETEN